MVVLELILLKLEVTVSEPCDVIRVAERSLCQTLRCHQGSREVTVSEPCDVIRVADSGLILVQHCVIV